MGEEASLTEKAFWGSGFGACPLNMGEGASLQAEGTTRASAPRWVHPDCAGGLAKGLESREEGDQGSGLGAGRTADSVSAHSSGGPSDADGGGLGKLGGDHAALGSMPTPRMAVSFSPEASPESRALPVFGPCGARR